MAGKEIKKFVYNPEAIDIAVFPIPVDLLHWKLLCKHAMDMNTTVEHVWAMVLEAYLINVNLLDPRSPQSEKYDLPLTIRELRENPDQLFNWRQNDLVYDGGNTKKEEKTSKGGALNPPVDDDEDDDDLDLVDFSS